MGFLMRYCTVILLISFWSCSSPQGPETLEADLPVDAFLAVVAYEADNWEQYLSAPPDSVVAFRSEPSRGPWLMMPEGWDDRLQESGVALGGTDRRPGRSDLGVVLIQASTLEGGVFSIEADVWHHAWDDIGDIWEFRYRVDCRASVCETQDRTLLGWVEVGWPRNDR